MEGQLDPWQAAAGDSGVQRLTQAPNTTARLRRSTPPFLSWASWKTPQLLGTTPCRSSGQPRQLRVALRWNWRQLRSLSVWMLGGRLQLQPNDGDISTLITVDRRELQRGP